MSYPFYLVLHLVGVFLIVVSLGGITLHMMNGGTREFAMRKWVGATHGLGLLIALIAGFGLLAKLGIGHDGLPVWVIGKLVIWLILGGMPAFIYRKSNLAKLNWVLIFVLAGFAAYLAAFKPGASAPSPGATIGSTTNSTFGSTTR